MFDSGALCHVTGRLAAIQDTKRIFPCSTGLSNGTHTVASKEGPVMLNKEIKLKQVLYVPSHKYNLVSIAKLCKEMNGSVIFFCEFCVL